MQILDGTGDSQCSTSAFEAGNGVGNLIVGYNEHVSGNDEQSGSHNIVVGTCNDWASHSGVVAGRFSTISGEYAIVAGGNGNTASGNNAVVSGGANRSATGDNDWSAGG